MIDRRRVLVAGGAALASVGLGVPPCARQISAPCAWRRLKFGSLSWVLETIRAEGLAEKVGLKLEIIEVATNQAGPVALLSGDADVIVSDWPWALRQRGLGEHLKFAPYSSALGAVMVPKDSKIAQLADLEGKKLGVAGGAIDKSWLLLRAYSRKTLGKDIGDMRRARVRRRAAPHRGAALGPPRRALEFLDLRGAALRRRLSASSSAWTRS